MEGIGSGAVTAPFTAAEDSDVIIVIGARPTENHPVAATFFKQAAKRGAKVFVMDPRGHSLVRHATLTSALQPRPRRGAAERAAPHDHRGGPDRPPIHPGAHRGLRKAARAYPRLFARRDGADLRHRRGDPAPCRAHLCPRRARDHLLGHGDLAAHPRHRQRALPDRAGDDHRPGRPAGHRAAPAARPEQRAGRVRRRADPDGLSRLPVGREPRGPRRTSRRCGARRSTTSAGLTVVEIMDAIHRDEIKGMYIMGENPAMSDPDVAACARGARQSRASRRAGHLPDRDREIRRCGAAGLGLAGEGRHRHQHQPPGADGPRARCRCPAMRGSTGGSSRRSRGASGSTGTTPIRATSSPR